MTLDDELKECAALALRNAFWEDFSGLVNRYLKAAEGLDIEAQTRKMGEMTSIYGRDTKAEPDHDVNIWTSNGGIFPAAVQPGHASIMEALMQPGAKEVHLEGRKVFEIRNGEWYFLGG